MSGVNIVFIVKEMIIFNCRFLHEFKYMTLVFFVDNMSLALCLIINKYFEFHSEVQCGELFYFEFSWEILRNHIENHLALKLTQYFCKIIDFVFIFQNS